jgi:hypothetical protein
MQKENSKEEYRYLKSISYGVKGKRLENVKKHAIID